MVATAAPALKPFPRGERRVMREQFDSVEKRDRLLDVFGRMSSDEAEEWIQGLEERRKWILTPPPR